MQLLCRYAHAAYALRRTVAAYKAIAAALDTFSDSICALIGNFAKPTKTHPSFLARKQIHILSTILDVLSAG
jgi:hypothetical protein